MTLSTDMNVSSDGFPYRVTHLDRIVNTFTESGVGTKTYAPSSGERVVISQFVVSSDTACTIMLSGDMSDPMSFYFGHRGGVSMQLGQHSPIIGEIDEVFSVSCTFTGGASGNCMSTIFGYKETKQANY